MTSNNPTPSNDELDEILNTIGVNQIDDKHVVGRTGAKQAIENWANKRCNCKKDNDEL